MNALCPKCLSAERSSWHAVTMVKNSQQQQSYRGYPQISLWLWEILTWSKKLPFFSRRAGRWCMSVSVITRHKNIIKQTGDALTPSLRAPSLMRMSRSSFQTIVSATRASVLPVVSLRSDVNSSNLTGAFHWCCCLPWCEESNDLAYRTLSSGLIWLAKISFPRALMFNITV